MSFWKFVWCSAFTLWVMSIVGATVEHPVLTAGVATFYACCLVIKDDPKEEYDQEA